MRRSFFRAGAALLAALSLVGPAAAEEFNASIWFPDLHPLTKHGYLEWAGALKSASNGELEAVVFVGTALLPPNGHLSGLRDGIAQVTFHAGTYTPAELPEDNVLAGLSLGLSDPFVAAFAVTDFYLNDPELQAMFARNGIVFLGGYASPPYRLMCTAKIETLADIKGKKIRVPGAAHAEWAKSVGAVPVAVPSTEMFTGLEKGQLDCAANSANDLKSRALWDVAKHITLVDLGVYYAGWLYAFNRDFWQGLSAEHRGLLVESAIGGMIEAVQGFRDMADQALADSAAHQVLVQQPAADLAASIVDFAKGPARDTAIQQGKTEFGLADPAALVERFEATVAEWEARLEGVDRNDDAALAEILRSEVYGKLDTAAYGLD